MSLFGKDRSGLGVETRRVDTPIGAIVIFAGDLSNPGLQMRILRQGWLPCDGRSVKIARYRDLHLAIGGLYTASGTGEGLFQVPDYGGQFLRGVAKDTRQDPGQGVRQPPPGGQSKASVGSTQADMVQTHEHHYQALTGVEVGDAGSGGGVPPAIATATTDLLDGDGVNTLTGEETRPRNIYVHFLIKAAWKTRSVGVVP